MSAAYFFLLLTGTITFIIISGSYWKWHPFFSLLTACLIFGIFAGMPPLNLVYIITSGFGTLVGSIGLIVVLGSILGVVLEESGAVYHMGQFLKQRSSVSPALGISLLGMLLGIPVFCDSGFIILVSLAKSLGTSAAIPLPTMTLGLAGGLYTTHTLVPPTPGPMTAAANLGASDSLGLVILLGIIVSVPVTLVAFFYARYIGKRLSVSSLVSTPVEVNHPKVPIFIPLVLILLPVILIAGDSVLKLVEADFIGMEVIRFAGHPLVALLITVVIGLTVFRSQGKINGWVEKGVRQAGPIILLTGCGGALGAVLKASPLSEIVSSWTQSQSVMGIGFLILGFVISTLFKSAQGSSTSALTIVSSLLAPLAVYAGFSSAIELSLLVLAIGAGAMSVSHANDSYFWVVSQFSGFDLKAAYRGWTMMTFLQGIVALLSVVILYLLLV
jgi:gluconate:H+ symporter, GntP family